MFTFAQWLTDLIKGHGHKYIKRIPYMTPKGRRYRYIYQVQHTHRGAHILDPRDMKEGAKFMVHGEEGKEVHAHITARNGNTVTFVYDDGDRKGESVTMHVNGLAQMVDEAGKVGTKLRSKREKLTADIETAKQSGASEKQIQRIVDRRSKVDKALNESHLFLDHPAYKRGGSPFMALIQRILDGLDSFGLDESTRELELLVKNDLIEEIESEDEDSVKYSVTDEGREKFAQYIEEKIEESQVIPDTEAEDDKEPELVPDPEDKYEPEPEPKPEPDTRYTPRVRLPDLGETIAGARKHMTEREMTTKEMRRNTTRAKLTGWQGFAKEASTLEEAGNTPSAAILKGMIIESISATPFALGKNDPSVALRWTATGERATDNAGQIYKDGVNFIMKSLDVCKTEQDVLEFMRELKELSSLHPSIYKPSIKEETYLTIDDAVANQEKYDGVMEHRIGQYGDLIRVRQVAKDGSEVKPYLSDRPSKYEIRAYKIDELGLQSFDGMKTQLSDADALKLLRDDPSYRVTIVRTDYTEHSFRANTIARNLTADDFEQKVNAQNKGKIRYKNARYLDVDQNIRDQMHLMMQVLAGIPMSPSEKDVESVIKRYGDKLSPAMVERQVDIAFKKRRERAIKTSPLLNLSFYGGAITRYEEKDGKIQFPRFIHNKLQDLARQAEKLVGKEWDHPDVTAFFGKTGKKRKQGWRFKRVASGTAERVGGQTIPQEIPQEKLMQDMDVRGLQWGNSMTRADQDTHVQNCYGALTDLADIIGIEPKHIGLRGDLGLAYGARGRGGSGAGKAHYEPTERVINLTRRAGAGSLAHEWGHALDHALHTHYGLSDPTVKIMGNTGDNNTAPLLSTQILNAEHNPSVTHKVPAKVREAYQNVINTIKYTPIERPTKDDIDALTKRIGDFSRQTRILKTKARQAGRNTDKMFEGRSEDSYIDEHNALVDQENTLREKRAHLQKLVDPEDHPYTDTRRMSAEMLEAHRNIIANSRKKSPSRFYADAEEIGRGYWNSIEEMFARAFESYIEDELSTGSRKNTYLVHGTQDIQPTGKRSMFTPDGEQAQIYPQGAERQRINDAMRNLMQVLREDGALAKSMSMTRGYFSDTIDQLYKRLRYDAR